MHISEGILKPEILIVGVVASSILTLYAFKTLQHKEIPKTAVLSALFFLASFIHIPIGPTSIHLVLGGIVGALLGMRAFIAIFIALFLQGMLFGYGGITTLGINLFNLATPTLLAYFMLKIPQNSTKKRYIIWFLVGFIPLSVSAIFLSITLAFNGEAFMSAAKIALIAHFPLMIIEGIITLMALKFIEKVAPAILEEAIS